MHDRADIRSQLVNQQVHGYFAGNIASSRQPAAFFIHDDQVRRTHRALAHSRGSCQKPAPVQAHGKVPVTTCYEAGTMQHCSQTYYLPPTLALVVSTSGDSAVTMPCWPKQFRVSYQQLLWETIDLRQRSKMIPELLVA